MKIEKEGRVLFECANNMSTISLVLNTPEQSRFNRLMGATYKKVFNMAYRLSGNRSDAEDLTQEAFYRAYRSFSDYEGDKPFENWIFRIVTRLFLDLLRNRRRRIRAVSYDAPLQRESQDESLYFDVPDNRPTPETELVDGVLSEELQMVLASLSAEQRMLVSLADVEGLPYKEIAEILGKPIGTIRSRLHRTHRLMRTRLERLERDRKQDAIRTGLAFSS